jgi:hypothetical protein
MGLPWKIRVKGGAGFAVVDATGGSALMEADPNLSLPGG